MALRALLALLCAALLSLAVSACSNDPAAPETPADPIPPEGFVLIPPGSFMMGSPETEPGRGDSEFLHEVTISQPFFMKAHEVTNEEYRQVAQWALDMGLIRRTGQALAGTSDTIYVLRDVNNARSFFTTINADGQELDYLPATGQLVLYDVGFGINPDHPMKYLTWWGAAAYCNWLSIREGLEPAYDQNTWEVDVESAEGYRLPTEAEWEYAARAGSATAFSGSQIMEVGCGADSLQYQGWYCFNATDWLGPVGSFAPNAFGLYDMHGNVWEFCNDWYEEDYYMVSPAVDPAGPASGEWLKSSRGGSWTWGAQYSRSAQRGAHFLGMVSEQEGIRVVRNAPQDQ